MKYLLLYHSKNSRIFISLSEKENENYAIVFNPSNVYPDNEGVFKCIKCLSISTRMWKGNVSGDFYCPTCKHYIGHFEMKNLIQIG
uniref:GATA-type domain-containing protein n=1 Tax=viral metagenome TaxID=1070528 RepID=A0A6M3KLL5_9ZZZZ